VRLDRIVSAGEELQEALGREHYLTLAGHKSEPEFHKIFRRHSQLTSADALAAVSAAGSPALLEWLVSLRVDRTVTRLEEQQIRWQHDTVLTIDAREIEYLRVPIELANSADRRYRIALDNARSSAHAAGLNSMRRDRFILEREEMARLGYPDYVDGIARLSGIDLARLAQTARSFLAETKDMYTECLAPVVARRLGLTLDKLTRADAAWTFRADRFDAAFPADRLVETAQIQMKEMGLDAWRSGRVRLDTQERPGKQARAFCVMVRVPEEVYLVIRPHGGHSDYRAFWHELGHAMHFSSPSKDLSFQSRWLGDASVTEGFAMVWDHMTLVPAWLVKYVELGKSDAKTLALELAVQELHLVRRYAAKLTYELSLHRSNYDDMGSEYASALTAATCFQHPEQDYLVDVDPGFYSARYLRAWQMEAALRATLLERFDEDWYCNPAAGRFLHELMERGQGIPADRLVEDVAGCGLSFEPVRVRLEEMLNLGVGR